MIKTKIFAANDGNVMCDAINGFIEGKKVIDIKYQAVTLPRSTNNKGAVTSVQINDRALVIYEE